mgnify:FL=1
MELKKERDYQLEQGASHLPSTGRPVVKGSNGIISSGHYLTSMAGMRILLNGGNAFDAMVAATFAAAVVEPMASYSLGAESVFMLYDSKTKQLISYSGQGGAPALANAEYYLSRGFNAIPTGPGKSAHLSFTVPGVVGALAPILDRFGTKTMREVIDPSICYAIDGIPNYKYMTQSLKSPGILTQFKNYPPGGSRIFFQDGNIPEPSSILVQKALGSSLDSLIVDDQGISGDRGKAINAASNNFYNGEISERIDTNVSKLGGLLTYKDLNQYKAKSEEPISTTFHKYRVHGQGTWSQAAILLQSLNILECFDLQYLGHNTPDYIHTVVEAMKLSMADREAYYGDPDFTDVPIDGLLSKEYSAVRRQLIDKNYPSVEMPSHGDPYIYSSLNGVKPKFVAPVYTPGILDKQSGTTHIAVQDKHGNMACSTPSGGSFEKSVFFEDLGFALSTRIEMFNLQTGHPNLIEPGKRPRTTLVNYIVETEGQPFATFGCPGGDHQVQGNLQLMLNLLVFGMNPQEAVEAPRFATDSVPNSFYPHVYYPGQLSVEDGIDSDTVYELKVKGHKVVKSTVCGLGATVTTRNADTGVMSAGADPRRPSYALAW